MLWLFGEEKKNMYITAKSKIHKNKFKNTLQIKNCVCIKIKYNPPSHRVM